MRPPEEEEEEAPPAPPLPPLLGAHAQPGNQRENPRVLLPEARTREHEENPRGPRILRPLRHQGEPARRRGDPGEGCRRAARGDPDLRRDRRQNPRRPPRPPRTPPEGRPRGPLPRRLLREQDRRPRGEGGKTRALDLRRGEHPDHTLPPRKDQEEPAGGSHARRGDRRKSRLHRPGEERLPRLHPRETLPQDLGRGHRPLPPPGQGLLPPRPHRHAPAKEEGQGDRVGGGEGEPAQAEEGRGRPQRRAGEAPQRDQQHKRQRKVRREAPRSASPAASAASPT